jgi:hypothetical protein
MAGLIPEAPTGDVRMLPGTFIVDRQGRVQFAHYSKHAGDHPEISTLLKATAALLHAAQ